MRPIRSISDSRRLVERRFEEFAVVVDQLPQFLFCDFSSRRSDASTDYANTLLAAADD